MSRFFRNKTDPGVTTVTSNDDVLRELENNFQYVGTTTEYIELDKVKDWAWKHFGLEKDSSLLKELGEKE